jgi:hypothetical protein
VTFAGETDYVRPGERRHHGGAGRVLLVSFSNPTNARIGGFYGLGLGLIVNDD